MLWKRLCKVSSGAFVDVLVFTLNVEDLACAAASAAVAERSARSRQVSWQPPRPKLPAVNKLPKHGGRVLRLQAVCHERRS